MPPARRSGSTWRRARSATRGSAYHVAGQVVRELPAGRELFVAAMARADAPALRPEVLVVRPDGDRVGAGDRDLQVMVRDRLEKRELVVVVRLAQRRLRGHGRLRVVLVVEAPHGAARLEAVGVVDGPRVHLRALLLAVVDNLDPGALQQTERVAARPAAELGLVRLSALQVLDELLVAVDAQLLAPGAGVLDVLRVQRRAGGGLDEPRRLRERSNLVRQQFHQAAASTLP